MLADELFYCRSPGRRQHGTASKMEFVLTDLETHVAFGRIDVGVAAEIFVDDVLILAGTVLLRRLKEVLCRGVYTYVSILGAFLLNAWAFDNDIGQRRRDKREKTVDELHFCKLLEKDVLIEGCRKVKVRT